VLASPIFSPLGKLRMGLECLLPARPPAGDESVGSFVRRRLGREALERLVQPLVGGIYTSDPESLSLLATLPRFREMERRHGSLVRAARRSGRSAAADSAEPDANGPAGAVAESGARYNLFTAPRGGMSVLVDALSKRIAAEAEIRVETPVISLGADAESGRLFLSIGRGGPPERLEFDAVVLAVPAFRAAELLAEHDSLLAASLSEIDYASSAVVVSGHALDDVPHRLEASGLVIPAIERRRILAVSFASRKFAGRAPAGKVLLRTFLGGAMQPDVLACDDRELVRIAQQELESILGVRGEPEFTLVARHERAMPQYHVGHLDRVQRIARLMESHPRLALAGNAYHGVGIPDCIHSGELAAERVAEALGVAAATAAAP
jgi:oxygen-dependent protoporphyrinogen oxidase